MVVLPGQRASVLRSAVARILTYSDSEGDDDDGEEPLKARPPPQLPEARKPGEAEGNVLGAGSPTAVLSYTLQHGFKPASVKQPSATLIESETAQCVRFPVHNRCDVCEPVSSRTPVKQVRSAASVRH